MKTYYINFNKLKILNLFLILATPSWWKLGEYGGCVYSRIFDISKGKVEYEKYKDSNWQGGGILLEDNEKTPFLDFVLIKKRNFMLIFVIYN